MSRVGKQWGGLRADLLGLEPDVHPVRVRGHQVLEHCATGAQLLQHEAGGKLVTFVQCPVNRDKADKLDIKVRMT